MIDDPYFIKLHLTKGVVFELEESFVTKEDAYRFLFNKKLIKSLIKIKD